MLCGFGICFWWRIRSSHPLFTIQQQLSKTYRTPTFPPHITIRSGMNFAPQELSFLPMHESIELLPSKMHASTTFLRSWEQEFYALELPVCGSSYLPRDAHVSLAYRFDRPFTPEEILHAQQLVEHITPLKYDHVESVVYDCQTMDVTKWKKFKQEKSVVK